MPSCNLRLSSMLSPSAIPMPIINFKLKSQAHSPNLMSYPHMLQIKKNCKREITLEKYAAPGPKGNPGFY